MALLDRIRFRLRILFAALRLPPIAGGAEDEPEAEPEADPPKDDPPPEETKVDPDDDWKAKARKHEREAKRLRDQIAKNEAELEKAREATKSEQEKALDKARQEAAAEVTQKLEGKLRAERLNAAIAREGAAKFADVDDAIRLLDTTDDDLFDGEGAVNTDALQSALGELLERKPHLAAGHTPGMPSGDVGAGKGTGGKSEIESWGVEEHLADLQKK